MTATINPVTETNREQSLDTLRGFAIIGVLFALFVAWDNFGVPPGDESTKSFKIIDWAANTFLHGKAYNLLAFLFGYGFALQASRAKQKGIDLRPFALRRALGLFLLGTIHAVLLRDGDILAPYAICSLFIIILRNSSNKRILLAILFTLFIQTIYYLILKWSGAKPAPWGVQDEGMSLIEKNFAYLTQHWYPHFVEIHSWSLLMFLVGMLLSRRKWIERIQNNSRQLSLLFIIGLILYILYFLIPWEKVFPFKLDFNSSSFYGNLFMKFLRSTIAGPFSLGIDMVYIAIILHLLRKTATRKMLQPLTNMGKMALTNYLLPDMLFIPLVVTLNLWSKIPVIQQVMMAIVFTIFLAWFSTWWLKRYNFGPFEWLLRSFTYWRWQTMRKRKKEIMQPAELAL